MPDEFPIPGFHGVITAYNEWGNEILHPSYPVKIEEVRWGDQVITPGEWVWVDGGPESVSWTISVMFEGEKIEATGIFPIRYGAGSWGVPETNETDPETGEEKPRIDPDIVAAPRTDEEERTYDVFINSDWASIPNNMIDDLGSRRYRVHLTPETPDGNPGSIPGLRPVN